jgi:hypothetical protein
MAVPPNRLRIEIVSEPPPTHSLPVRLVSAAIMVAAVLLGMWVVMMIVWGIA